GDLGVVSQIDMEEGELHIDFDGRAITYAFGELERLVLAYATTIHKSQGSEYPAVVIPLSTQHYQMLQRNLVYTGVTRGKVLAIAIKGARTRANIAMLKAGGSAAASSEIGTAIQSNKPPRQSSTPRVRSIPAFPCWDRPSRWA